MPIVVAFLALVLGVWLAAAASAADRFVPRARSAVVLGSLGAFVARVVYPAEWLALGGREPLGCAFRFVGARRVRVCLVFDWLF